MRAFIIDDTGKMVRVVQGTQEQVQANADIIGGRWEEIPLALEVTFQPHQPSDVPPPKPD